MVVFVFGVDDRKATSSPWTVKHTGTTCGWPVAVTLVKRATRAVAGGLASPDRP